MNLESGILNLISLSLLFSFIVAVAIFDYSEENIVSTGVRNASKQKAESKENPQSFKLNEVRVIPISTIDKLAYYPGQTITHAVLNVCISPKLKLKHVSLVLILKLGTPGGD